MTKCSSERWRGRTSVEKGPSERVDEAWSSEQTVSVEEGLSKRADEGWIVDRASKCGQGFCAVSGVTMVPWTGKTGVSLENE